MAVSYGTLSEFEGWSSDLFSSLLSEHRARRILEIGSGANPTLAPEFVRSNNLTYVTSDISPAELEKANPAFERLVLDLSASQIAPTLIDSFDCILSRMVAEHIQDGETYHRNILQMLRPGGIAVHCFSTLWSLPFVVNRFLPETLNDALLRLFLPRDRHRHEKFKAYYSWSRGPTASSLRGFRAVGFEVLRYTGYFGHPYYSRIPWLHRLEMWKSRHLAAHPVPQLSSYATVVLRKPGSPLAPEAPIEHPEVVRCSTPS